MAKGEYDCVEGGLDNNNKSTLDRHQDFEPAGVNDASEPDRDREAEESDDDDDGLGEIVLPHDFHGLFEGLYRAVSAMNSSHAYFCLYARMDLFLLTGMICFFIGEQPNIQNPNYA